MVIPSIILYCTKVCLKLSNLTAGFGVKGRGRRDRGLKESKFKRMKVLYSMTFVFLKILQLAKQKYVNVLKRF